MIVDTSIVIAILAEEPESELYLKVLVAAGASSISAGSWVEVGTVIARRFGALGRRLPAQLLQSVGMAIEPVTAAQAWRAQSAYRRYGIGTGKRPCLNFGDCFAYALAIETGRPLLFKGNDFSQTDVISAL